MEYTETERQQNPIVCQTVFMYHSDTAMWKRGILNRFKLLKIIISDLQRKVREKNSSKYEL